MAGIFDRFLNSMKLYEDDDEFEDEEMEMEPEEEPAPAPSRNPFRRNKPEPQEEQPAASSYNRRQPVETREAKPEKPARASRRANNVVSMKGQSMEVCMVKPSKLDDAREICDILLSGRAVVINMEGVHVDLAQRIIDFTSGACFSINGNLQKISKYIFIVSPSSIDLTGDFQDVFEGNQDLSTLNLDF